MLEDAREGGSARVSPREQGLTSSGQRSLCRAGCQAGVGGELRILLLTVSVGPHGGQGCRL